MKKAAIGLVGVLVILGLGLPPLLGMMTESSFRESLGTMDENPMLDISVESFDRGWFSSEARIAVGLDADYASRIAALDDPNANDLAAAAIADTTATFIVDVDHGPFVLHDGFYVGLSRFVATLDDDSAVINEIRTRFAMPYLVEIRGRMGLTGAFNFDADVPPVDFADENGQFVFSGLLVEGSYRGSNLTTSGHIDEVSFEFQNGAGRIRGIRFDGDNERLNSYIWTGPMEMAVDSVIVTNPLLGAEPMFNLSRLRVAGDTRADPTGELVSGTLVYAVDSVEANSDFMLRNAELSLKLNNLSVAALETYYDTVLTLDPANPLAALTAMQQMGTELLRHDPSIAIAPLHFEYDGEPFTANIEVRTVGGSQAQLNFSNPMMLASLFEVSADATTSKTLATELATMIVTSQLAAAFEGQELPPGQDIAQIAAQQAEVMLSTFVGQGLVTEVGDGYTTNIEYANGQVTVNGTPLPLGMLFQ
jgi:uncharacterized protein YdgA (DUF945 family)